MGGGVDLPDSIPGACVQVHREGRVPVKRLRHDSVRQSSAVPTPDRLPRPAAITNEVYYPSANLEARKYVDKDVADDPAVYPPPDVIKTLFLLKPLPPGIQRLQTRLWTEFKSGR
jgi:hypothetical protein